MSAPDKATCERAAEILLDHAREVFVACDGGPNVGLFCCADCPNTHEECRADHAEMIALAVKLRADL